MTFQLKMSDTFTFDMHSLRQYLKDARPVTGFDIVQDACGRQILGAVQIVEFCLALRSNVRSRRTLDAVSRQMRLRRGGRTEAMWFTDLCRHLLTMYRQWQKYGFPRRGVTPTAHPMQKLSRKHRRHIAHTGTVSGDMPTMAQQASEATTALWNDLAGQQVLLWIDNWYCPAYGVNPHNPVTSTDVTAAAVLLLSTAADGPALHTRSHQLPPFPGHTSLDRMVLAVRRTAVDMASCLGNFLSAVANFSQLAISREDIRVPLDMPRGSRRNLQWRPLTLYEDRVSCNSELFNVVADLVGLQPHTGCVMPLLLDEKVHYTISRFMLANAFRQWDVAAFLQQIPLLYGVWSGRRM